MKPSMILSHFSSLLTGDIVDWNTNMKILKQLLDGVNYIHNLGLMHRDLKVKGQNLLFHEKQSTLLSRKVLSNVGGTN